MIGEASPTPINAKAKIETRRASAHASSLNRELTFTQRLGAKGSEWWRSLEDARAGKASWSPSRRLLADVFDSWQCDIGLGCVVMFNVWVLISETDVTAPPIEGGPTEPVPGWCSLANKVLLAFYCVEVWLRLFTFRLMFFHIKMNVMDLIIIIVDIFMEVLSPNMTMNVTVLRMFRLLRLVRVVKLVQVFPELYTMLKGFSGAMKSIMWGMLLINGMLVLWSILSVQVILPLALEVAADGVYEGCDRCPRAFENVFSAFITLTQHIVYGDSWGMLCIPIIERYSWTYFFFAAIVASVGMGVMNLILAVIVDASVEARKASESLQVQQKEEMFRDAAQRLEQICMQLDADNDGVISLQEVMAGYKDNKEFQNCMRVMDVGEHDMKTVFEILDEDRSGDVHYDEFVDQLYKLKSEDSRTMMIFMKFYLQEIMHRTAKTQETLAEEMMGTLTGVAQAVGAAAHPKKDVTTPKDGPAPDSEDPLWASAKAGGKQEKGQTPPPLADIESKLFASDQLASVLKIVAEAAPLLAEAAAAAKSASLDSRSIKGVVAGKRIEISPGGLDAQESPQVGRGLDACNVEDNSAEMGGAFSQRRVSISSTLPKHNTYGSGQTPTNATIDPSWTDPSVGRRRSGRRPSGQSRV